MNVFQNIRVRLTLWYLLIVAILVTFFGMAAFILLSDSLSRRTIDPWEIQATIVEQYPEESGYGFEITELTDVTSKLGIGQSSNTVSIKAFTRDELLAMADTDGIIHFNNPNNTRFSINRNLLQIWEKTDARFIWFYFVPVGTRYDVFVVSQSAYNVQQTLAVFKQGLLIAALITLILAGILGYFLVSRMLQPVQSITRIAREIEENNLSRRLKVEADDELGRLAKTLNQTFSRLEAAFSREREFTADASHELRTPLAIAQGEATLALKEERSREEYQKALESISRQLTRTSSLINRLLFLARSDDRLELVLTEIDLNRLLSETAQDARILCEPKVIALHCETPDTTGDVKVKGDIVRLRELLLNLLENAVRYTPEGGIITLTIRQDDDFALISVSDTGIGISPEHLPRIFERFYRVDKSRSRTEGGAGLGLAICRRITEVHGGHIEVESIVGKGTIFTVFLPIYKRKPD